MLQAIFLLCITALQPTPYKNGSVGVSIEIPEGASVIATTIIPPFCMIAGSNPSNNWHLRLDRGPNPSGLTPRELVLEAKKRVRTPDDANILTDISLAAGNLDGWWLLVSSSQEEDTTVVGWYVIPAPGQQYLMASVLTDDIGWQLMGESILASLQSIRPLDPVAAISEKIAGLDAASNILSTINERTLRPLVGFEEWRRIQTIRSGESIPSDIGYARVSVHAGNVDNLNVNNKQNSDNPTGIIVMLQSRLVPNPETGVIVDSTARYWMSWDGKEERWSNRVHRWVDKVSAIESETGIRNRAELGSPKPKLLVLQQDLSSNKIEPPFETIVEEPWLPRAMVWILGPWLLSNNQTTQYIWRTYENTGTQRVVTRYDTMTAISDGSTTITTKFGEGGDSLTTTVDVDGHLVIQKQVGGVIVSGSSEETLKAIWQPRNLW